MDSTKLAMCQIAQVCFGTNAVAHRGRGCSHSFTDVDTSWTSMDAPKKLDVQRCKLPPRSHMRCCWHFRLLSSGSEFVARVLNKLELQRQPDGHCYEEGRTITQMPMQFEHVWIRFLLQHASTHNGHKSLQPIINR